MSGFSLTWAQEQCSDAVCLHEFTAPPCQHAGNGTTPWLQSMHSMQEMQEERYASCPTETCYGSQEPCYAPSYPVRLDLHDSPLALRASFQRAVTSWLGHYTLHNGKHTLPHIIRTGEQQGPQNPPRVPQLPRVAKSCKNNPSFPRLAGPFYRIDVGRRYQ